MQVRVNISYISGERFLEADKFAPAGLHIATNVNIVGLEQKEDRLVVPFVVTISYNPSVAQVSLKGQAFILGSQDEVKQIHDDYKNQKGPPHVLLQAITAAALTEATVISRSINIPPPIPLPNLPPVQGPAPGMDKDRPSYVG